MDVTNSRRAFEYVLTYPARLLQVNVGSVAEGAGLQAGDAIVSIGGSDGFMLRHKEAQDTIIKAGSSFQMVVQRLVARHSLYWLG